MFKNNGTTFTVIYTARWGLSVFIIMDNLSVRNREYSIFIYFFPKTWVDIVNKAVWKLTRKGTPNERAQTTGDEASFMLSLWIFHWWLVGTS